tara:strand:- start:190 stop:477 length:288 start_codon:yes stop_codon:yes gene_type:complete
MITIMDIAKAEGAQEDERGGISGGEFERLGLPILAGCQGCGATLGAYNAYPTRSGYVGCADCTPEEYGYQTVADYRSTTEGMTTVRFHLKGGENG